MTAAIPAGRQAADLSAWIRSAQGFHDLLMQRAGNKTLAIQSLVLREVVDSHQIAAHMLALSADDRAGVDAITEAALAGGGREHRDPQDMGFMYSRSFEDLDGHIWEPFHMDMAAMEAAHQAEPASA